MTKAFDASIHVIDVAGDSERVDDPRSERMVRNYRAKMVQYNLVSATGRGQQRRYQCV